MPSDTKTALLDSAESAARSRGFDGFSYADLAEDVGIRKASIHHHFATKAALSVALMVRYRTELEAACAAIIDTHPTASARLIALADHYRTALEDGKSLCLCVSFSTSRESLPDDVISEISRFREMMLDWIEGVFALAMQDGSIADVAEPKLEATATLPLLEGAQLAARAEENLSLFDDALRLLLRRAV